jgi:Flp pilus assembly protein TadG
VVVIVAAAMVAIMGLVALGTDVGQMYLERTRLVTIADAAALAGAQRLPLDPLGSVAAARDYLRKNGYSPDLATVTLTDTNHRVSVTVKRQVPMTFARVIGYSNADVGAVAEAKTSVLTGKTGAAPLGVPQANWAIGQQVVLKLDAQDGTIAPGNYQALALGRSGSASYENNLMYGYPGWVRAGDWIDTETGNMATPTVRAAQWRINQDPYSTYTSVTRQSSRLLVIPVLEDFNVNGKGQVHVVGFATFYLEKVEDKGDGKGEITGRFMRMIAEGEASGTATDFGVYTTKLVR